MVEEPLFIKFLNNALTIEQLVESLLSSCKDENTKNIIEKNRNNINLTEFRKDFRNVILDIIDNGITQRVINYVNSYMKCSLSEVVIMPDGVSRTNEVRYVCIKDENTPWAEAIICYNLCLYIKVNGIKAIKQCPICGKFFSYKGKYAKYCSNSCLLIGKSNA